MSRAWMPMYWGDYLADTPHFSKAEHGAYLLLIAYYWCNGALPNDEDDIRKVAKCDVRQWPHFRKLLQTKFDSSWRHKRIDAELAKAIERSHVNSANAKRRHKVVADVSPSYSHSHSQSHEEAKASSITLAEGSRPKKQKRALPENWQPNDRHRAIAAKLNLDLADQLERFHDYLSSNAVQYADYDGAFRNFLKNAPKFSGGMNGHGARPLQDDSKSASRAAARLAEAAERGEFSFGPRPSLLPDEGSDPVRLLPKG